MLRSRKQAVKKGMNAVLADVMSIDLTEVGAVTGEDGDADGTDYRTRT